MGIAASAIHKSLLKVAKKLRKNKLTKFTLDDLNKLIKSDGKLSSFLIEAGISCGLFTSDKDSYVLEPVTAISIDSLKRATAKRSIKNHSSFRFAEDEQYAKAASIAHIYEDQLGKYSNNNALRYLSGGKLDKENVSYDAFLRAAMQADTLGVTYELYIKAQFYWYDKWFGKAPKPREIASYKSKINSIERVRLYEKEIYAGKASKDANILGKVRSQPKISLQAKLDYSEQALRRLMKNYNATEEDILKVFAKGDQATLYFDRNWLKNNVTYNRLKDQGEL